MGHIYKVIGNTKELSSLIKYCKETKYCSFDFETSGTDFYNPDSYITMMSVSFQPGSAWLLPLGHFESRFKKNWIPLFQRFGREVLEDLSIIKIAQNFKFEHKWCLKYGVTPKGRLFDTMLAKHLLDEERPHSLESMVKRFIPEYADYKDDTELLARKTGWANIPFKELADRNALDADLTLRLMLFYENRLIKGHFYNLFRNMLMMQHRVLSESEFDGLKIDVPYLKKLVITEGINLEEKRKELLNNKKVRKFYRYRLTTYKRGLIESVKKEIEELVESGTPPNDRKIKGREEKISQYIAGNFVTKKDKKGLEPLNLNAPKQLTELFFESKKGFRFKSVGKTDSGADSTDEKALKLLEPKDKSGFITGLLEYRGMSTLYNTFIVGIHDKVSEKGRVHASFKIHGTVTGRLSCVEPNLQNIPRDITSSIIKKMFIPGDGFLLLEIDYAQAELRILAELSNDKAMIEIFEKDYNIHTATACKMNGGIHLYDEVRKILKDPDHPDNLKWEKEKKKGKSLNFSIVYQQGDRATAETLGITPKEAHRFKKEWFDQFPSIRRYVEETKRFARKNGYVKNPFGRKRRLPNLYDDRQWMREEAERQSINAPIQGCSSEYTQWSTILIREARLRGEFPEYFRQLYTVHDSIGYPILPEDVHDIVPRIVKICQEGDTLKWFGWEAKKVKMKVSPELGINWGSLSDYNPGTDYTKLLV